MIILAILGILCFAECLIVFGVDYYCQISDKSIDKS